MDPQPLDVCPEPRGGARSGRGIQVGSSAPVVTRPIASAPCCELRTLVLHTYPDGIKAYGHERITTPMGRRGKPVKKLRLIPAEKAFALARKFQGRFGTTVSVL